VRPEVPPFGAAHERAQPRLEFLESEGLHHVVVCAGVQAGDAIVHRVAGGEHQQRGGIAGLAQAACDREPVEQGHADVEDDGVEHRRRHHVQRLLPVGGERHLVTGHA
jgi:hypothetical protein